VLVAGGTTVVVTNGYPESVAVSSAELYGS